MLPFVVHDLVALSILMVPWGLCALGTGVTIQHRLVSVDPARATANLPWYSTALYLGTSLAPLWGGLALEVVGPPQIPHASAIALLIAMVVFQLGFLIRPRGIGARTGTP